jgi:hypothetical protein
MLKLFYIIKAALFYNKWKRKDKVLPPPQEEINKEVVFANWDKYFDETKFKKEKPRTKFKK